MLSSFIDKRPAPGVVKGWFGLDVSSNPILSKVQPLSKIGKTLGNSILKTPQPFNNKMNLLFVRHKLKLAMIKNISFGLILLFALSCNNKDNEDVIKQENGEVWLSGGLYYCAQQVRLDNGDTLIVSLEDLISFRSGDRVNLKYKEIGVNENCSQYIDCVIIEIKKIE